MSAACIYDGGRDGFLAIPTSKPPSKFDSIEHLERDVHDKSFTASSAFAPPAAAAAAAAAVRDRRDRTPSIASLRRNSKSAGRSIYSSNVSSTSSNATTTGAQSWGGDCGSSQANTEVTNASWRAEVSGVNRTRRAPSTAPALSGNKKFFWGPRAALPRQEVDRNVRSTNMGEPVTFALAVDKSPSTVSSIRSLVPRKFLSTTSSQDHNHTTIIGDLNSAYVGMEPYIRTSITDRAHDGVYDTDKAHKSTLGNRIKSGEIRSPHMCRNSKRFPEAAVNPGPQEVLGPGYYETSSGIDATSHSSAYLPLSRDKCDYDFYIRKGLGQTTGSAIGPGHYGWEPITSSGPGPLSFSTAARWAKRSTTKGSCGRGPWDDVREAWGRGGYIERDIPRECKSYMPREVFRYLTNVELDDLGKESFATAMQRSSKRYAASFSQTQVPNWRVKGDPALGPGTYATERGEKLTLPAPLGGAGDADPARPSLPFRVRYTPFDTRHLAAGYKTLRPRFSTPRSTMFASELSVDSPSATADLTETNVSAAAAGTLIPTKKHEGRRRLSPAAKAKAIAAAAAANPWGVGGRDSKFVRLERPSVFDPVRDGSRRRAAAATWSTSHRNRGARR